MRDMQQTSDIAARVGAFLFAEGGAIPLQKLSQLVECSQTELAAGLKVLAERLVQSGISLIQTDTEAGLSVSPNTAEAVEVAYKHELEREIGDAGLEVLAILLYRGPSTHAEIDYIRGVNTSSTIRTLLARGLVLRESSPNDARAYIYKCTVELLVHLGITDIAELPDYVKISNELALFEKTQGPFNVEHGNPTGAVDVTSH